MHMKTVSEQDRQTERAHDCHKNQNAYISKNNLKLECVAKLSMMAARWVDRNSGSVFRHLWTKVHVVMTQFLRRHCNLQCHFPIDDILLHSEDNCNKVEKLSNRN